MNLSKNAKLRLVVIVASGDGKRACREGYVLMKQKSCIKACVELIVVGA